VIWLLVLAPFANRSATVFVSPFPLADIRAVEPSYRNEHIVRDHTQGMIFSESRVLERKKTEESRTVSVASMLAPRSSNSATVSVLPLILAHIRAVRPSYRDEHIMIDHIQGMILYESRVLEKKDTEESRTLSVASMFAPRSSNSASATVSVLLLILAYIRAVRPSYRDEHIVRDHIQGIEYYESRVLEKKDTEESRTSFVASMFAPRSSNSAMVYIFPFILADTRAVPPFYRDEHIVRDHIQGMIFSESRVLEKKETEESRTLSVASMFAPRSSNSATMSVLPYILAYSRAVLPSYRDEQIVRDHIQGMIFSESRVLESA
jgi:hypothetical protein